MFGVDAPGMPLRFLFLCNTSGLFCRRRSTLIDESCRQVVESWLEHAAVLRGFDLYEFPARIDQECRPIILEAVTLPCPVGSIEQNRQRQFAFPHSLLDWSQPAVQILHRGEAVLLASFEDREHGKAIFKLSVPISEFHKSRHPLSQAGQATCSPEVEHDPPPPEV